MFRHDAFNLIYSPSLNGSKIDKGSKIWKEVSVKKVTWKRILKKLFGLLKRKVALKMTQLPIPNWKGPAFPEASK